MERGAAAAEEEAAFRIEDILARMLALSLGEVEESAAPGIRPTEVPTGVRGNADDRLGEAWDEGDPMAILRGTPVEAEGEEEARWDGDCAAGFVSALSTGSSASPSLSTTGAPAPFCGASSSSTSTSEPATLAWSAASQSAGNSSPQSPQVDLVPEVIMLTGSSLQKGHCGEKRRV